MYRARHYYELDRKDRMGSSVSFPSGIVVMLIGLLAYLSRQVGKVPPILSVPYAIGLIVLGLILIAAVVFLAVSYSRYTYKDLPTSDQLEKYQGEIVDLYKDYAGEAERVLESCLMDYYRLGSTNNAIWNDRRSAYLYTARGLIIGALGVVPLLAGASHLDLVVPILKLAIPHLR